ncbi:MAG: ArsR family transcriptional regulator, partial [Halobacteriales archaeon]
SDESNRGTERWIEETSAFDRVRSVAFALQRPRTAGQIAESAHVSEKAARGHLQRLVEMDILLEETGEGATTYYPDPAYMRYREVRTLARDHDRDELTEIVATLKRDIEQWREEFAVETPDELRASVADTDVSEQAVYERRTIAEDWEYTEYRLGLIKDALAQYDRLTARPPATA